VVVLGHRATDLRNDHRPRALCPPASTIIAPDYVTGLSASLRAGLQAIAEPPPEAVLICLGDMPTARI
jgi:CTP:molybdopterin cytidylyltransferase MocA